MKPILNDLKQLAINAHSGTSFSPEVRGEQLIKDYSGELTDDLNTIAAAGELMKLQYQARYTSNLSSWLAAKSRCFSSMISGPSNFPVRQQEKRRRSEDNKYQAFREWRTKALNAIAKQIQRDKPEEQKQDEAWKSIRKSIISSAATIIAIDKGIEKGYTRALFVNSIADLVKRLAKNGQAEHVKKSLELITELNGKYDKPIITAKNSIFQLVEIAEEVKIEKEFESNKPSDEIPFNGGKVVLNYSLNRLQIMHDVKPGPEVISKLKSEGFRWSPSNTAWQLFLHNTAKYKASRITGVEIHY